MRFCPDLSTACRKRRDTSVGMTAWGWRKKARHFGRDDSGGLRQKARHFSRDDSGGLRQKARHFGRDDSGGLRQKARHFGPLEARGKRDDRTGKGKPKTQAHTPCLGHPARHFSLLEVPFAAQGKRGLRVQRGDWWRKASPLKG
jgi:hypothetical protein